MNDNDERNRSTVEWTEEDFMDEEVIEDYDPIPYSIPVEIIDDPKVFQALYDGWIGEAEADFVLMLYGDSINDLVFMPIEEKIQKLQKIQKNLEEEIANAKK